MARGQQLDRLKIAWASLWPRGEDEPTRAVLPAGQLCRVNRAWSARLGTDRHDAANQSGP
jgi:hypothetical protein